MIDIVKEDFIYCYGNKGQQKELLSSLSNTYFCIKPCSSASILSFIIVK